MGWIEKYQELVQFTEPPPEFHLWCAIAGLGHVLGRKVWLDQHLFKVYPAQMMVLLCSESAVARKTIAMRCMGKLIETLPEECWNIIPQRVSGATLLDALNRVDDNGDALDAVGMIFAEELGTFFSREQNRVDLPTLVTELNDAKEGSWKAPTRTYGEVVLSNPCVGMVAGITRTGLAHEVPTIVRRTGFLGRCIVVDSEGAGQPQDLIDAPPKFNQLRAWLIKDLYRIASLQGPMRWTHDAAHWYKQWYPDHFYRVKSMELSEASGWLGRKHVHLLRTALILSCAMDSGLVYTVEALEQAERALGTIETAMPRAMREVGIHGDDQHRKDQLLSKLERLSERNGQWVPQRKLFQYVHRWYAKGGWELYLHDLRDYAQDGTIVSKSNEKGQCTEWKIIKRRGKMLKGVPEGE